MKIFVLLLNVTSFWLLAEPAHAGPVLAAIPALLSSLGAVGSLIAKVLLTVALNLASTLLQRMTAKKQKQQAVGVKLEIQMGDDLPVSTTIGRYATAGKRKYAGTYGSIGGTPNAMFVDVIELGNMPVSGLQGLWIDDEKCTIMWDEETSRGFPIYQFQGAISKDHHAWIKFYDGTQTQPNAYLRARFGDHPNRPFLDTMIGRGCPYAVMTFRFNRDMFGGAPTCVFELGPLKLYDIRKDSSAGGNGPHRWNAPSTWEPSTNLPVMIYNIIRGLKYNDQWMFGGQDLAASRLPASNWIAAAQEASRLIRITDQPSEPQFRGGYEVTGDMEPLDVIDDLRAGCAARIAENGGSFKIHVGAFAAAVFAISDDDIIVTEDQSFEPFPGLDATVNAIKASYPEPDEKWASKDAPTLYRPSLEIEDGNRVLPADVQFPAVPYKRQVQRLMRMMIEEERRFRTHQFYLPPQAWVLEPNDVISWTSERNGYENKKFVILAIEGEMTLNQLVTIKEIDPADYDWSPEFEMPTSEGWMGRIEAPVQEMDGWSVAPASIDDNDGNPRRVAIKVECADGLDDVMKVWVQVRNSVTGDVVFDSDQTPYADPYEWLLSGDWCLPITDYEARGKYVPFTARKTNWSAWLPVITFDTRLTLEDLEAEIVDSLQTLKMWIDEDLFSTVGDQGESLRKEIEERIAAVQAQAAALAAEASARAEAIAEQATALTAEASTRANAIAEQADAIAEQADAIEQEQQARISAIIEQASRFRGVAAEIDALRDYIAENDFAQFDKVEKLRTLLTTRIGQVVATYDEQITLAVSQTAALAQRTTTLEVTSTGLTAQVLSVESASVGRDAALADRVNALSAGTDNQFDPLRMWAFDTDLMGWTGDVAPVVSNGYLRPGDSAAPYSVSPIALGVDTNTYRQIRARIRKTGNPVWEGQAWWNGIADFAWSDGRRVTITAPSFDANGLSNITFDMPWTGTVDQVRIDLSVAQSATDYFQFDWISIGSPSPGASRAELYEEQSARASGDSANASSITALQALFLDVNGDVTALASGLSTITTTVENLEDSVAAQSQSLTALNTQLGQKANATALALLSAQVDAMNGGGGIVIQGQSTTALRNELTDLLAETTDAAFAAFLGQQNVRNALTTASQTLTTRIDATNDSVDIVAKAVTLVQAALPGKAEALALQSLEARVTATEGSITSSSTAITSLQSAVAGKADASALQSLQTVVIAQGDDLEAQAQSIGEIQVSLDGKAAASALSSLQTTVSQQGTTLSSQSTAITSLQNGLNGKASASAVSSLQQTVSNQGDALSSQGSAITSLQNALPGKADASALQTLASTVGQQGNAISSQGSAITSVQNALSGKANASAVQSLSNMVTQQGDVIDAHSQSIVSLQVALPGKADASAIQTLASTVGQQGDVIDAHSQSIISLQVALPGKADASALQTLASTVGQQGNAISSQGSAITSVQNALSGKADASAVQSLSNTVTQQGDVIDAHSQSIISLQVALPGKADASALQTLASTVGQQGNSISSQGSAITSLQNALGDKASVFALSSLSTVVSEHGGQITAQATSLQGLSATVGSNSADARFKMEVQAGPGGYARIGARARVDAGSDYREAGFFIDVPYDGANPTQFLVDAQRFALIANGGKNVPFAVDQNGAYLQSAYIRKITTDQITFKDGSVQDTAVAQNAVAERRFYASASTEDISSVYTSIGSVTIDKSGVDYLEVDAVIRCQGQAGSVIDIRLREGTDNNGVDADSWTFTTNNEFRAIRLKYMVDSGSGIRTYSIIARVLSGSVIAGRRTLAAKRDKKSNA
ncbi:hypothetical protein [Neorhizobium sp. IRS_2294]|uniref:hypothetical protein n=1 Tax=unclassified Neorhizobium TaxID=2629175 RepID=UPI003D291D17